MVIGHVDGLFVVFDSKKSILINLIKLRLLVVNDIQDFLLLSL